MDRTKFLEGLKGVAVKLRPVKIPGFVEPVYVKPFTMADIKAQLAKDEPAEIKDRLAKDQYYIERAIARIVRDEKGALLFDESNDAQMAELRVALDDSSPSVNTILTDAQHETLKPDKSEVDPKGN